MYANDGMDERLREMIDRKSEYHVRTLEEWKLNREGRDSIYLRLFQYYNERYWEMSTSKNHYGRIWERLDSHFTDDMIRTQVDENNGERIF